MDRVEEYIAELNHLKADATSLIDQIINSETPLEKVMNSTCEEIKRIYIDEAKNLIDEIALQKLKKIEREESTVGAKFAKIGMGLLTAKLIHEAEKSESARRLVKPAYEGYRMDETKKKRIGQASEIVKRRIAEQTLSMKREEFLKSLKGSEAMRKSLNAMFKNELHKLR